MFVYSILTWDSWRGPESDGMAIRNLVLTMAAIAALPLAIWRSKVAERQAETAQRGLLNERYQKGAEMLGSDVLTVRLAGIYALARLDREHSGIYHVQIINLLCAFVRNPTTVKEQGTNKLSEDIQAVMTEIGSRDVPRTEIENKDPLHSELVPTLTYAVSICSFRPFFLNQIVHPATGAHIWKEPSYLAQT